MNLSDLTTEVVTWTRRPDLAPLILSATKASIRHLHGMEDFPEDILELTITDTVEDVIHSFIYRDIWTTYRKLKYVVPLANGTPVDPLELIDPRSIFDDIHAFRTNVFYVAGENLQIRTALPSKDFVIAAYIFPTITDTTTTSWIAASYPYAVIHKACANVFNAIGLKEDANSALQSYQEEQIKVLAHYTVEGA
jgi:hypothetical protein